MPGQSGIASNYKADELARNGTLAALLVNHSILAFTYGLADGSLDITGLLLVLALS